MGLFLLPIYYKPINNNVDRYYTKRPFVTDERLALLHPNLFQGAQVLDVGCNEGWVTCEVGEYSPSL